MFSRNKNNRRTRHNKQTTLRQDVQPIPSAGRPFLRDSGDIGDGLIRTTTPRRPRPRAGRRNNRTRGEAGLPKVDRYFRRVFK